MELTKKGELLVRVATLSLRIVPEGDFKNRTNCMRIWEAFSLGRDYQRQEEIEK